MSELSLVQNMKLSIMEQVNWDAEAAKIVLDFVGEDEFKYRIFSRISSVNTFEGTEVEKATTAVRESQAAIQLLS
ncbi:DUF2560 family protein [Serratia nevei]|uniref:DUF2560 family protein n=1 Tax=Serratia nevei TaxID=2703794 RepID=UPI003FA6B214